MSYSSGCFVFYKTSRQCTPRTPDEIAAIAAQYGIDRAIVPAYAGDKEQVLRAIAHARSTAARRGWLVRPIKQTAHDVVQGIVRETRDAEQETVAHAQESTLRWSDANGQGGHIDGQHPIAYAANSAYQLLRGTIGAADWTGTLTDYLRQQCNGMAMKDNGHVYWCPPQAIPTLRTLQTFLDHMGIYLVLCEIEPASTPVVQETVQEGLADQLQRLRDEVDGFDGTQSAGSYRRRIEEYERLRTRATLYKEALGIGVQQAQELLAALEHKVTSLLLIRSNPDLSDEARRIEAKALEPLPALDSDEEVAAAF